MFGDRYFVEKVMRWGFAAFLVLFVAYSFISSPFQRVLPPAVGPKPLQPTACHFELTRDLEHTAALGIPQVDALLRRAKFMAGALRIAQGACQHDKSLKTVYLHVRCDQSGGGERSRTVYCQ